METIAISLIVNTPIIGNGFIADFRINCQNYDMQKNEYYLPKCIINKNYSIWDEVLTKTWGKCDSQIFNGRFKSKYFDTLDDVFKEFNKAIETIKEVKKGVDIKITLLANL